ncbi:cytochrome P450 3A11-like [Liolophura sinensis]|uniref:cytochrome P450 3A11-like n=1 Tax=Liolophura sinensis TaxID=3198878 RepID=UPI00315926C8
MDVFGLFNLPLWVIILVAVLILFYRYQTKNFGVFKKMGVPFPSPWPMMGNARVVFKKGFVEAYEEWFKTYGRVFGHFEGQQPMLVVGDLDMLREITVKEFNSFTNRRDFGAAEIAEPPVTEFLTVLQDDDWRHNRNTLTPAFSGGKLKKMIGMIVEAGESFVAKLKTKADNGEPVDIKGCTEAFTMDVIAATAFGMKLDTQISPDDPFIKYARKFFDIKLNMAFIILFFFPFLTPLIKIFKLEISPKVSIEFFRNVVNQALEERRKNPGKYSDFLQLMVNAKKEADSAAENNDGSHSNGAVDEAGGDDTGGDDTHWKDKRKGKGLSDSEILAASILFFIAGFDTTASTLAHLLYHLALNPDHMDKLIDEIDEHYPNGKAPDYETVGKLSYLDMVVQEGLRINPPFARMDRVCKRDVTIKGIHIPAGMTVALPIYMIHHDPGYWTDPEVFDPERFTPENKEKHHPLQWIPFGYGPRNCIGMRLALFEMKVIIVQLLQRYRFVPNSKTKPLKFKDNPLLSNTKDGVWLTAEHRK